MNQVIPSGHTPNELPAPGHIPASGSTAPQQTALPETAHEGHNFPRGGVHEDKLQPAESTVSRRTRDNPDKRPKRMKISAKTEYACIAMLELASQYGSSEPVRIRRIAERHDVPPRFLVQILLQLKGAGLVASVRGAAGGYHLIKPPQEVSLGQIMEVIEGAPDANGQSTSASPDSPAVKVLQQAWQAVTAVQRQMLNEISLAELLEQAKEQDEQMYYI